MNGKIYSGDPIVYHPLEDCIFEEPKNITINLHRHIAQYVKIELFWAKRWILISEVTFDARKSYFNVLPYHFRKNKLIQLTYCLSYVL